ncbi:MAG: tRNA 2-thiouridine(34) synthase MnmA [Hyphomicrobiaceae bacterium]
MLTSLLSPTELRAVKLALDGIEPGSRIVAAMSGGVDSAFVAGLLAHLGWDVVGITLQLYDHGAATGRKGACCAVQDIHDARRVADRLGIPHYVLDYESRFRHEVIDRFVDSYVAGETPVPCVACNQSIKFGDMAAAARELGAKALATGHYIKWQRAHDGPALFRAVDRDRDQSYFLFATRQEDLDLCRFPLGGLEKATTRKLAEAFGLPVASKPDSQDICFVPSGRYSDLIERLRPDAAEAGEIVHIDGRILGKHRGIMHFTVGQRRGLGIASGEPLYVVRLEPEKRRVVVGPREALLVRRLVLREFNWLGEMPLEAFIAQGGELLARVRSTHAPQAAIIEQYGDEIAVLLNDGEYGVARGQACVLYTDADDEQRLLGGGWIAKTAAAGGGARSIASEGMTAS